MCKQAGNTPASATQAVPCSAEPPAQTQCSQGLHSHATLICWFGYRLRWIHLNSRSSFQGTIFSPLQNRTGDRSKMHHSYILQSLPHTNDQ